MRTNAVIACAIIFSLCTLGAASAKDTGAFTKETYCAAVAKTLAHELTEPEKAVAVSTWDFYDLKWKNKWDQGLFDYAVEKGADNCGNKAMLASAKAGKSGKKGLIKLVEATGNGAEKFSDWVKAKTSKTEKEKN